MKKSSIFMGASALILSVAGANAETIKPFAGATLGLQIAGYSDEADNIARAGQYDLPDDWLNADFMKSDSYSDKLFFHSEYYKTFANCVDVRTVTGKYLLAMKMKSGRIYKRDLSDIVGIIKYEDLTKDMIVDAVVELYGSYDIDDNIDSFVDSLLAMDEKELDNIFSKSISQESENKELLLKFNELYHIRLDRDKINQTIEEFKQSKQRKDD